MMETKTLEQLAPVHDRPTSALRQKLIDRGILLKLTNPRPYKELYILSGVGLYWGRNEPGSAPLKDTYATFYIDMFEDLLALIDGGQK
jgi:hypothetical protein